MTQADTAGFTLLEVLIALAILAIAAAGLMSAASGSLQQAASLEDKTIAGWVAQNRMAELRAARGWPELATMRDKTSMAGREWALQVNVSATPNPELRQIEITVGAAGSTERLVSLSGFLGKY